MEVHSDIAIVLTAMGELELSLEQADEAKARYLEAETHYRRVLEVFPKGWIKNNLAHGLIVMKRFSEAVPLLQDAEKEMAAEGTRTNLVQVCFNLGLAYEGLADWDNALRSYQRAFQLAGQENEAVYAKLAGLALRNGHAGAALRCFEAQYAAMVRKNIPQNADLTAMLAWLYATLESTAGGDPAKAVALAEQAAALAGHGKASVENTLAAAYLASGRYFEAAAAAQKAFQKAAASGDQAEVNKARGLIAAIQARQAYRTPAAPLQ
jgi:tetratricopeptide (TPR) repeat protein